MRIALIAILGLHGLIHLLGVASSWRLATVPQMTGRTTFALPPGAAGVVGALWLVACLLLVGAAVLVLVHAARWWWAAAVGVVVSQLLVVYAWPDARAGTVPNLLLVVPILVGLGQARFETSTDRALAALFATVPRGAGAIVTAADLAPLPPPVQRWLRAAGVVGSPRVRTVRLRQQGELRTTPTGAWMPAVAEQSFTVDEPGFVWSVRVTMNRVLPVVGRDSYLAGHGRMRTPPRRPGPIGRHTGPPPGTGGCGSPSRGGPRSPTGPARGRIRGRCCGSSAGWCGSRARRWRPTSGGSRSTTTGPAPRSRGAA